MFSRLRSFFSSLDSRVVLGSFRPSVGYYNIVRDPNSGKLRAVSFSQQSMMDEIPVLTGFRKVISVENFPLAMKYEGLSLTNRTLVILDPNNLGHPVDYNCDFLMIKKLFKESCKEGLDGLCSTVTADHAKAFFHSLGFSAIGTWLEDNKRFTFFYKSLEKQDPSGQ